MKIHTHPNQLTYEQKKKILFVLRDSLENLPNFHFGLCWLLCQYIHYINHKLNIKLDIYNACYWLISEIRGHNNKNEEPNSKGYYWMPGKKEPRIEWLEQRINFYENQQT